eukprot:GHUV01030972.1.p1 GENE.GHUV01030972.1~~GHUV01030972.1.p1  ORF type:complete len:125 (-),score=8.09 GHUV01030972.1:518-892(-)
MSTAAPRRCYSSNFVMKFGIHMTSLTDQAACADAAVLSVAESYYSRATRCPLAIPGVFFKVGSQLAGFHVDQVSGCITSIFCLVLLCFQGLLLPLCGSLPGPGRSRYQHHWTSSDLGAGCCYGH